MDYKKFHQAVVLAYINDDPNMEKFGKEVVEILNEFRAEEQAAEQKMHPTLLESEPILDSDGELVGTRSVEIKQSQSG